MHCNEMKVIWLNTSSVNISAVFDSVCFLQHSIGTTLNLLLENIAWLSPSLLYTQLLSSSIDILEHILFVCLAYFVVCLGIYKLLFLNSNNTSNDQNSQWQLMKFVKNVRLPSIQTMRRVLFIISHPDDECMFFGPLIYSTTQLPNCQVYVMCLSNGNYEQQAQLRREELWRSCSLLGVPSSNIILVNATNLPDDPNVEWKIEVVANLILKTVESLDIQAIFTFDPEGISQHPNHCAVYYAAASLRLDNLLPKDCKFYTLDSINVLRKYLSIFDLFCTCCMSTYWCVLNWQQATVVRNAMKEHKSQMKWFRWLYIYFSRYMFINSIREVNLSDVELEMQIHDD